MNEHVAAEVLAAYVDGTLPGRARQEAESHLCRCRECRLALVEIGEIRSCRTEIPQEFLQRALDDAGGNRRQMDAVPNRNVMPLRLAFGVAAVFLVALAVGYLFIGRERVGISEIVQKRIAEPTMAPEQKHAPVPAEPAVSASGAADAARAQAPAEALPGLKTKTKLPSGEPSARMDSAASPVKSAAPQDAALKQERLRVAEEMDTMPLREGEGGVIGGVETPPEKDNFAATKLAAPAPVRDKGSLPRKAEAQLQRFSGSVMAVDALQLFLAATGRAAAPRLLRMECRPAGQFRGRRGDGRPARPLVCRRLGLAPGRVGAGPDDRRRRYGEDRGAAGALGDRRGRQGEGGGNETDVFRVGARDAPRRSLPGSG